MKAFPRSLLFKEAIIMKQKEKANVLWFDELHRADVNLVGGKSSSLGELTLSLIHI